VLTAPAGFPIKKPTVNVSRTKGPARKQSGVAVSQNRTRPEEKLSLRESLSRGHHLRVSGKGLKRGNHIERVPVIGRDRSGLSITRESVRNKYHGRRQRACGPGVHLRAQKHEVRPDSSGEHRIDFGSN